MTKFALEIDLRMEKTNLELQPNNTWTWIAIGKLNHAQQLAKLNEIRSDSYLQIHKKDPTFWNDKY